MSSVFGFYDFIKSTHFISPPHSHSTTFKDFFYDSMGFYVGFYESDFCTFFVHF